VGMEAGAVNGRMPEVVEGWLCPLVLAFVANVLWLQLVESVKMRSAAAHHAFAW
jgi:hypothetical protein